MPGYLAETNVRVTRSRITEGIEGAGDGTDAAPRIEGNDLVWDVELGPRRLLDALVRTTVRVNDRVLEPIHDDFGDQQQLSEGALTSWLAEVPRFRCESALLKNVLDTSIVDLAALRIEGEIEGERYVLPAAGLPWFMTLFGRDTLITALQTVGIGPDLARGALHLLGALQGREVDDFRDEEPGKILHEFRQGELTVTGVKPHSPYFGTADATPLYLILMSDYWRWTADDAFVRDRWSNVLAALEWIDRYGDRDGDGFVEYQTRSSQGLGNQCWKDSWDGVQFADGGIPNLPIATCELQGYVYDAKLRVAELAERVMDDAALAERLRKEADVLADRFNDDVLERRARWLLRDRPRRGQAPDRLDDVEHGPPPVVGHRPAGPRRDGRRPADGRRRCSPGWGVRTLSSDDAGFNPIGYHVGTIWPHDNALVAAGLARYGFRDDANAICLAQLEAASVLRLPPARGLRRPGPAVRAIPGAVSDGVQPAGLGDRRALRVPDRHAGPGREGRGGEHRSPRPRGARPRLRPRPPRVRHALGRRCQRLLRIRRPDPLRTNFAAVTTSGRTSTIGTRRAAAGVPRVGSAPRSACPSRGWWSASARDTRSSRRSRRDARRRRRAPAR